MINVVDDKKVVNRVKVENDSFESDDSGGIHHVQDELKCLSLGN